MHQEHSTRSAYLPTRRESPCFRPFFHYSLISLTMSLIKSSVSVSWGMCVVVPGNPTQRQRWALRSAHFAAEVGWNQQQEERNIFQIWLNSVRDLQHLPSVSLDHPLASALQTAVLHHVTLLLSKGLNKLNLTVQTDACRKTWYRTEGQNTPFKINTQHRG